MARTKGARDKKKREQRNAYGLTPTDLRRERKKTKIYMGLGAVGGGTAGTLLARSYNKKKINPKLKEAEEGLNRTKGLANAVKDLDKSNQDQLARASEFLSNERMQSIRAGMQDDVGEVLNSAKKAQKSYQRSINSYKTAKGLMLASGIIGGASLGAGLAGGYLAQQRAKKTAKYRKTKEYKQKYGT